MALESRSFGPPVSTCTFQGWVLVPDGARLATARMASISVRGTGAGKKARMLRLEVMAKSTAARSCEAEMPAGGFLSSTKPSPCGRAYSIRAGGGGERDRDRRDDVRVAVQVGSVWAGGLSLGAQSTGRFNFLSRAA
jgi:hypothetical protein